MYNNSSVKKILLLASIVFLYSCDKDYNSIGDDLIGGNNFDFSSDISDVVAYNQKIGPVQSNNLDINALGIYEDPAFGKTTANFATQLSISPLSPTIGPNAVIESVVLTIPYFVDSSKTTTNTDGSHTYVLDSIYGPEDAVIKLSVYESGYFMRELDPISGFLEKQMFFTNQNSDFDNVKIGTRLNNDPNVDQNDAFFFDPSEYVVTVKDPKTNADTPVNMPPAMRLNLDTNFFKTKILDAAASGKLATNVIFKEYFRGLYFKVEKSGSSDAAMAMLNFKSKDAKITIKYKEDTSVTDNTKVEKTIVLNLSGNMVSLLEQSNPNPLYSNATNSSNVNTTLGDEKLYLKGGEGSMAIIELFGKDLYGSDGLTGSPNGVADGLDIVKKKGWLINEANLVFHVDAGAMANSYEPNRVYLYDFKNSRPVIDYFTDGTTAVNSKNNKALFGGILKKESTTNGRGLTYKVRITNHVLNLIRKDSTNVKLGLVVSEDINTVVSSKLRTPDTFISKAPKASVMNPLGTVLYGSKSTVADDKRIKLEIIYTKLN
jgi:uncharacterized protein YozE (UPF0346 family)